MKKTNRIAAALLALIMMITLAVPALASGITPPPPPADDIIGFRVKNTIQPGEIFAITIYYKGTMSETSIELLDPDFSIVGNLSAESKAPADTALKNNGYTYYTNGKVQLDKAKSFTLYILPGTNIADGATSLQFSWTTASGVTTDISGVGINMVTPSIGDAPLIYVTSYRMPSVVRQNEVFDLSLNYAFNSGLEGASVEYFSLEDANFTMVDSKGNAITRHSITNNVTTSGRDETEALSIRVGPNVTDGTHQLTFKAIVQYTKNGVLTRTVVSLSPINVNVNVPTDDSTSSASEPTVDPILTPHLIITGFSTAGAELSGGENIPFSVSFKNTSKSVALQNIVITVTLPAGVSMPFASTNFYIDKIGAGKEETLSFTVMGKKGIEEGVANLGIAFNYQFFFDKDYKSGTDSETLGLMFAKGAGKGGEDRFEINDVKLPDFLYPEEEEYVTITVINKGKEALNNVQAKIESTGLRNSGATEYFGLLDINKKAEIELPMIPKASGEIKGTIVMTYEIADGTVKTMTRDFSSFVEEMNVQTEEPIYPGDPGMNPEDIPQAGLPTWAIILIAVGGVVVVIVAAVVVKKVLAKKKQAALDADDAEDD